MQLLQGEIKGKQVYRYTSKTGEQLIDEFAPNRKRAIRYLVGTLAYLIWAFTVCFLPIDERPVQKGQLLASIFSSRFGAVSRVKNMTTLRRLFTRVIPDSFGPAGEFAPFFEDGSATPLQMVGAMTIEQLRSSPGCSEAVQELVPTSVCNQLAAAASAAEGSNGTFVGLRTNLTFPWLTRDVGAACPTRYQCSTFTQGIVPNSQYPYGGYAVLVVNQTYRVGNTTIPLSDVNGTLALFNDFIDLDTRFIRISVTTVNPAYQIFVFFSALYELPVSGGVFGSSKFTAFPSSTRTPIMWTAEVVIWLGCACWIAVTGFDLIRAIRTAHRCPLCLMKPGSYLVAPCWTCHRAVLMSDAMGGRCAHCDAKVPPLYHICYRKLVKNFWVWWFIVLTLTVMTCRSITQISSASLADQLQGLDLPPPGQPLIPFLDPVVEIWGITNTMSAITAIMACVGVYRRLGIFKWSSTFVQVFSNGGGLIAMYLGSFFCVFCGFVVAFHVLLCEDSNEFATISAAFPSTFQLFTGDIILLDLFPKTMADPPWVTSVMYVCFLWAILLMGFTFLISLVTSVYRGAMRAQHYDVEKESLQLIFAPLRSLRTQLLSRQGTGALDTKRSGYDAMLQVGESGVFTESTTSPNQPSITKNQQSNGRDESGTSSADAARSSSVGSGSDTADVGGGQANQQNVTTMIEADHGQTVEAMIEEIEKPDPFMEVTEQVSASISTTSTIYKQHWFPLGDRLELLNARLQQLRHFAHHSRRVPDPRLTQLRPNPQFGFSGPSEGFHFHPTQAYSFDHLEGELSPEVHSALTNFFPSGFVPPDASDL